MKYNLVNSDGVRCAHELAGISDIRNGDGHVEVVKDSAVARATQGEERGSDDSLTLLEVGGNSQRDTDVRLDVGKLCKRTGQRFGQYCRSQASLTRPKGLLSQEMGAEGLCNSVLGRCSAEGNGNICS